MGLLQCGRLDGGGWLKKKGDNCGSTIQNHGVDPSLGPGAVLRAFALGLFISLYLQRRLERLYENRGHLVSWSTVRSCAKQAVGAEGPPEFGIILPMAVTLEFERRAGDPVMGIDEAGRGPLVGGVYAAAVSVPLDLAAKLLVGEWSAINDSKKLSEKKRFALAEVIRSTPGCVWAVASASPAEIDRLNILNATHLAMRRAAEGVTRQLSTAIDGNRQPLILVDGLPVKSLPNSTNVIKGDAKSLFIAAASILAKTARDEDCFRLEREYPGYGFAKHKGYPTKAHMEALAKLGPCPEHRRSFGPVAQMELALG